MLVFISKAFYGVYKCPIRVTFIYIYIDKEYLIRVIYMVKKSHMLPLLMKYIYKQFSTEQAYVSTYIN